MNQYYDVNESQENRCHLGSCENAERKHPQTGVVSQFQRLRQNGFVSPSFGGLSPAS